ncbi:nucleotidyltransferase domain-containing protein [bacterium]|nr:nucleotidyltransferase domain-containing protein [bacterium]
MAQEIVRSTLLKQVKTAIQALVPDAEIVLYGSRATGTARSDSDWDFLILLPIPVDRILETKIKDCLYDIELETDTVLSSIIRSKQEWLSERYAVVPLRQQVESYGVAI